MLRGLRMANTNFLWLARVCLGRRPNRALSRSIHHSLGAAGNTKRKRRSRTVVGCGPYTAMMTLDDGATDGQANPHAVALSRVERIEELVNGLRFQTHPRVLHSQTDAIGFVSFGSDHQLPWSVLDVAHRVRGVQEQV